jgi:hypothetical protein
MGTASALVGEYETCALRDALTEWLGYTLPTVRHGPAVSGDPRGAALGGEEVSRCADVGALRMDAHQFEQLRWAGARIHRGRRRPHSNRWHHMVRVT